MVSVLNNKFTRLLFFGNYFYGLCAIALSIEAMLQQGFPMNRPLYFVLSFASTVLFYSNAYVTTEVPTSSIHKRTAWYARHHRHMIWSQIAMTVVVVACMALFAVQLWQNIRHINAIDWFLILVFPVVAFMYYGLDSASFAKYTLRNIGWLKPFIIGFIWAGLVTVYPVMFYCVDHDLHYNMSLVGYFLFIKNFMYITVLCIMFDIKDYAMDYNHQLKTFVVKLGLRKTIFYIIIPLCIAGLGSFITYAFIRHFHFMKIALNMIPFILILLVAYSLHNRKSIFYYLIIIDGLMLVKALCGTIAMIYF